MSDRVGTLRQKRGPVYVEWHIENYFSYTDNVERLESPVFPHSDETNWWLRIHPNGVTSNPDYIVLCVMKDISNKEYHVAVKLGILKPNDSVYYATNYVHTFKKTDNGCSCSRFVRRSDLLTSKDTIANDGILRIFCILRFVDNAVTATACGTSLPKSHEILTKNFKDLYLDGRLCDVTLKVKNTDFQAHKSILVARSSVFSAMFDHDMVEKRTNNVNITDCEPNSFNEFLLFLYTGNLETVSPSIVFGLYETANKYDVKELKEECVQLMEHNLSADTFSDTVLVAVNYNESELLKSATAFFIENAEKIVPTTKWEMFMAENSSLAKELIMKLLKIKPVTEEG